MSTKRHLTNQQEEMRLKGLRALARIIARHALAHPDRYGSGPALNGEAPTGDSAEPQRKDGAA